MDREGELYKSDVDDPGEICPEAIEAADFIDDAIELARVSGNWEGTYTSIMATVDNAICKAKAVSSLSEEERCMDCEVYNEAVAAKGLRAQLAEWNRIKAIFREEAKYRSDVGSRNPYHGHAHDIPGIWDSDNGPLAGHECAACAAARVAMEDKEAK